MDELLEIEKILENAKIDAAKFYKKQNFVAGTRCTINLLLVIKKCKTIRKEIFEFKNASKN